MCGLVGFLSKKRHLGHDDLTASTASLVHRGPDAFGVFMSQDEKFGLGHQRLSILDLSSSANQPFYSQCGRYIMVYNGEVYNFKELAELYDIHTRTTSDTEVILEAFCKIGPGIIEKLNGMFSLIIYDNLENRLFIARDRLGIKPLYIYQDEQNIVLASELKAISILKRKLSLELDHNAVSTFLHIGYIPEDLSIYRNVRKFKTGTYAEIDASGNVQCNTYWRPEVQVSNTIISNEEEAKTSLNALINKSVKRRLISDVSFGTFLSGGIDSSLVTAVASKNITEPLKTFSIGFKESKVDESRFAKEVAAYLKTDHTEYILPVDEAKGMVENILDTYDEPFSDSSSIPSMLVSKLAKEKVTMVLTGDGGDELFHGYGMYDWARRISLTPNIAKPVVKLLLELGSNRYKRASGLFSRLSPGQTEQHIFSQEQYLFSRQEINRLMKVDYTIQPYNSGALGRKLTKKEEQALFDINYYLKDDLLVKVDRATMQYSLEARVPLLDHEIVEFALNVDPGLKVRNGEKKYLLKSVLFDYVPSSYFDRPKGGFNIPLSDWLRNDLYFLIEKYLNKNSVESTGIFCSKEIKLIIDRFNSGHHYLYNRLWALIQMNKFLLSI